MVTSKEELVAASIHKQIASLEGLLAELKHDPVQEKEIFLKIRAVETALRALRNQLQPGQV